MTDVAAYASRELPEPREDVTLVTNKGIDGPVIDRVPDAEDPAERAVERGTEEELLKVLGVGRGGHRGSFLGAGLLPRLLLLAPVEVGERIAACLIGR